MDFESYEAGAFYDEMFEAEGRPRPYARLLIETIQNLSDGQLLRYQDAADRLLQRSRSALPGPCRSGSGSRH